MDWSKNQIKEFQQDLLSWYDDNKKPLLGEKQLNLTKYGFQKSCPNKHRLKLSCHIMNVS